MASQEAKKRSLKANRIQNFGPSVFSVWTQLAKKYDAINLGQGYPDFEPPAFVLEAGHQGLNGYQQYSPLAGMPQLREALAKQYGDLWDQTVLPDQEITMTIGATEGIYLTIQALIDPGDEVLLLEPFYDSYPASVIMAGGIPKYAPLLPDQKGGWELDFDQVRAAITNKTKLLVLNTPNNPTGKCFTRKELQQLADLCMKHDIYVLADEVYDQLYFDQNEHISIATLDGMWERTVTVSSVGKTFSVTGWKIGWAIASPALTAALQKAQQWICFSIATPLQAATAEIIQQCEKNNYYQELRQMYQKKRDFFVDVLRRAGLKPFVPQGTYFITADTSDWGFDSDEAFCHHLVKEYNVVAIPPSHFYSKEHQHLAKHFARFAFCKKDEILEAAAEKLLNK